MFPEIDTPSPLLDLDVLEGNIVRLQRYLDEHGISNRPHIKTHKIPEIARMQIDAGAAGICCQKLGEAEVMVEAGIEDIFIPYNIVGARKLERLGELSKRARLSLAVDSMITAEGLSRTARKVGEELEVLVEFDGGAGRCGVQSPQEASELARNIAALEGLHFVGVMTYPTNEKTDEFVEETARLLEREGLQLERVSGGGTHCMWETHRHRTITEHRAGMYAYGDRYTLASGAVSLDQCAFTVLATVVSRPTSTRCILDAGSKSLASDLLGLEGHGMILEYPEAILAALSEEHAHVHLGKESRRPEIGERVRVLPNHCCVVSNLFDEVVGTRGDRVEQVFSVAARGAVR